MKVSQSHCNGHTQSLRVYKDPCVPDTFTVKILEKHCECNSYYGGRQVPMRVENVIGKVNQSHCETMQSPVGTQSHYEGSLWVTNTHYEDEEVIMIMHCDYEGHTWSQRVTGKSTQSNYESTYYPVGQKEHWRVYKVIVKKHYIMDTQHTKSLWKHTIC